MPYAGLEVMGFRAGSVHWVTCPKFSAFLPGHTAFEAIGVALLTQDKAPRVETGLGMNLRVRTSLGILGRARPMRHRPHPDRGPRGGPFSPVCVRDPSA